mgnify:CR=1 FL=1
MPSDVVEFAPVGKPLRKFRVSMGGGEPKLVIVEDQKPFTRKLMRHSERVRDLGDGRKRTEMILDEIEHTYDFATEMKADAVRGYNSAGAGSSFSFKQLDVEDLGPVAQETVPAQVLEPDSGMSRPRSRPSRVPEMPVAAE